MLGIMVYQRVQFVSQSRLAMCDDLVLVIGLCLSLDLLLGLVKVCIPVWTCYVSWSTKGCRFVCQSRLAMCHELGLVIGLCHVRTCYVSWSHSG